MSNAFCLVLSASSSAGVTATAVPDHGHEYAVDAMLCATALAHPGRVTILTSGVEDIRMLTARPPRVVAEKV